MNIKRGLTSQIFTGQTHEMYKLVSSKLEGFPCDYKSLLYYKVFPCTCLGVSFQVLIQSRINELNKNLYTAVNPSFSAFMFSFLLLSVLLLYEMKTCIMKMQVCFAGF